jgi:phosphate ABC transporter phosphate-binding protein
MSRMVTKLAAIVAVTAVAVTGGATPAAAQQFVPISGAGSTWSQNAVDQWRRNVAQFGMTVNYSGTGSSDGRNQFAQGQRDFAVSEIPYGLRDSIVSGGDNPPSRGYAYMPIVAGGTAFMYHLRIGNQRVTNLRLSGDTLTRIFTGRIQHWDDQRIKTDNPGLNLPHRRIIPVVRSDGSGTTAQFTLWMSKQHSSLWNGYCQQFGGDPPCGLTSYYPYGSGSGFVAQSGSLGVSGYVAQDYGEGAITYVEYSYALNTGFPVAKVLNASNYYVEPTAQAVAVGLLEAGINDNEGSPQYLTQELDGVYRNDDRRAYPLSSYSYMILPTRIEGPLNTNKGYTLAEFSYYFLCEGQQQAEVLGYSPLPINLVEAGLEQVRRIPGVKVQNVNIRNCNNPTFSTDGTNTLAEEAPFPPDCDRRGPTQCTEGTGGAEEETPVNPGAQGGGGPSGGQEGDPGGGNNNTDDNGDGVPDPGAPPTGDAVIDPDTGEVIGTGGTGGDQLVAGVPVSLEPDTGWQLEHTLMLLAGLLLAGLVLGPPLLSANLRSRTSNNQSRRSP